MFLAVKEIKKEKRKFLLIVTIFVLISYLVYFLLGLANGLAGDNRTAVDQWQAKQVVLAKGSSYNINASMMTQETLEADLKGIPHDLINLMRSTAYLNGQKNEETTLNMVLIGMDPASEQFPEIIAGRPIANEQEAIATWSLKENEGLEIGDQLTLSLNEQSFKIVGFTKDYKFNVAPVIYTQLEAASTVNMRKAGEQSPAQVLTQVLGANQPMVSAALIYTDQALDLTQTYDVISIDKFIRKLPGYYAQLLTFGLMIGFLIVIAAIVLGVFLYIMTLQKRKVFGIMKIQGISTTYIGKSVIIQTFLITLLGIGLGWGLVYVTELGLPAAVPFKSNLLFNGLIALLMLITSQIGAVFSVKSVAKVDPLEVI